MPYADHLDASRGQTARCALLTLSDTRTESTDTSGRRIHTLLTAAGHAIAHYAILPDDPALLGPELSRLLDRDDVDVILTNGGTGISRRDQTIGVLDKLIEQPLSGFGELFRMLSWNEIASGAMLTRATAGITRGKLLFAMPGSTPAVELAMTKLILPELPHLLHELRK